jgi:diguanylate cyclase (GGDEF)-like protein
MYTLFDGCHYQEDKLPQASSFDSSIVAILDDVRRSADLEGVAILHVSQPNQGYSVLSSVGFGGVDTVALGYDLLVASAGPAHIVAADKRSIIALRWTLPPAAPGGLLLWRAPGARPWTHADHGLVAAIAALLRTFISNEVGQIGIDRQTGLPNRRWFIDEVDRHIERLDLDGQVGTLCFVDIDNFYRLTASQGRLVGDRLLTRLGSHLRTVIRPGDLIARVGDDEFAVWQNGMDHLTAAERANALCSSPLFDDLPQAEPVTVSIGIASRTPDSAEDVRSLLKRAQQAAEDVRGQGSWRVSQQAAKAGGSGA